ncbi:MAG: hypothetical protein Q7S01_04010 [bacterium]|nr:hypothetical protein [bacterium]
MNTVPYIFALKAIALLSGALIVYVLFDWSRHLSKKRQLPSRKAGAILTRSAENPILDPNPEHSWEDAAVFNPAACYDGEKVHLLYRAIGSEGVSRIGYAVSDDGVHFRRFQNPAFIVKTQTPAKFQNPFSRIGRYDTDAYASGGGWGGSEDPRAVLLDGRLYMTFSVFESWDSIRMALTSIDMPDCEKRTWRWTPHLYISPPNETHKNWVLFPEKIRGKFALLHALTPKLMIDYADSPREWEERPIKSNNNRGGRAGYWDEFVRGAAAPPMRTKYGWLLLYHGMSPKEGHGYKVGAMILDINEPTKILYRSNTPILEPKEWYENDGKPGVVYASGAVIKDGTLIVYYGGGDKRVNVATSQLDIFLNALIEDKQARLVRTT